MAKSIINLTDNIATWVNKANTTVNRVGDLANLNTSQDSSLVGSINALDSDIRGFLDSNRQAFQNADSDILVTVANNDSDLRLIVDNNDSDLRVLIDILDSDLGIRTNLITTDKEDIVSAINEVKAQVDALDSSTNSTVGDLNNLLLRNPLDSNGTLVDAVNNLDSDLTSPFFDQRVRDLFAATGDLTYDSSTGQFGVVVNNESIQDAMDSALSNGTQNGITVSYNDAANVFNFDVNDPVLTISGDAAGSATMTNLGNTTISVSLAANTVNSSELASATRLRIYNSSGSVVKDLYGSGS
jgi:hypothetical protein